MILNSEQGWLHGGRPWEFWKVSGQFLYVFGEALADDDASCFDDVIEIKAGITTDPKKRLAALRQSCPHGVWFKIVWMESSAPLVERVLHELFNPWRKGFEREWFHLPREVYGWLADGMDDSWSQIAKQDRIFNESVWSICDQIISRYYPAPWLDARIEQLRK